MQQKQVCSRWVLCPPPQWSPQRRTAWGRSQSCRSVLFSSLWSDRSCPCGGPGTPSDQSVYKESRSLLPLLLHDLLECNITYTSSEIKSSSLSPSLPSPSLPLPSGPGCSVISSIGGSALEWAFCAFPPLLAFFFCGMIFSNVTYLSRIIGSIGFQLRSSFSYPSAFAL